jgi:hypothetical protein
MNAQNETTISISTRGDAVHFQVSAKSGFAHAAEFIGALASHNGGSLKGCIITLKEDRPPASQ